MIASFPQLPCQYSIVIRSWLSLLQANLHGSACLSYSNEQDVFGFNKLASVDSLQTPQIWHGFTNMRSRFALLEN